MTGNIIIENHQGRAVEIHIEGIIGTPERDSSPRTHSNAATYARFRQQLEKLQAVRTSELIVHIRSTGGNVNDALLIHDTLRNLDCEITTRCYGYTASAATLIAQAPKVGPYKQQMSQNLARALGISAAQVNVKATTEERLGFTGDGSGMAAHAVVLVERIK